MIRVKKIYKKGFQVLGLLLALALAGCGGGEPVVETINRSPENTSTTLASYGEYNWVGTWSKFTQKNGMGPNSGEAYGYFNLSDLPTNPTAKKYWIFLKGNFCAPTDAYRYFTTAGYEGGGNIITDSNGNDIFVFNGGGRYIFMVDQPGQIGAGDSFDLDVVDNKTLSGHYRIGVNYCDSALRDAGNITLHPRGGGTYTAPDTTPPTVSSTSPANSATNVAVNTTITATFNETIDASSLTTATFALNNGVTGTVTYTGTTATFTPSSNLEYSTTYTATITTGVKDAAGNAMSAAYTWTFTTGTATAVPGANFRMPDTNQTTSYATTFGEDNDYTINPPSYTNNANGTITDNVTGLIWQEQDDATARTWDTANEYCNNLTLAGQTDWRLPSRIELISIVDYGVYNPSINTTYFPSTISSYYWSSTSSYIDNKSGKWYVHFFVGGPSTNNGKEYSYARCVRSGE